METTASALVINKNTLDVINATHNISHIHNDTHINKIAGWCSFWVEPQHILFQLANVFFFISYAIPSVKYGIIALHSLLIVGFFLLTTWAWRIVCAPDIFIWNLCFLCINAFHLIYITYQLRPISFDPELEEVYHNLFRPFKVSRLLFKKLVSEQFAQITSLHVGEAYAMQNITRTDRLGLLLTGKVNVLQDHQILHPILPCEFLDSPEFESRVNKDDKFKVSIIAAVPCRYIYWQRSSLEYLFSKETYLATVLATLVATDITNKLYTMNNKIVTEKGSHMDIRLPSITSALAAREKPSVKKNVANICPNSPDSAKSNSHERLLPPSSNKNSSMPNGRVAEMEPLHELPSVDDLTSLSGVESWLDSSSKYHSCELIDE